MNGIQIKLYTRNALKLGLPNLVFTSFEGSYFSSKSLTGQLLVPLSGAIQKAFEKVRSIKNFYSHQASAINSVMNGRHVVVSTSTASGKSAIYQVASYSSGVTAQTDFDRRQCSHSSKKMSVPQ